MGCASSKPAAPEKKLDADGKRGKDANSIVKVQAARFMALSCDTAGSAPQITWHPLSRLIWHIDTRMCRECSFIVFLTAIPQIFGCANLWARTAHHQHGIFC